MRPRNAERFEAVARDAGWMPQALGVAGPRRDRVVYVLAR
jgi:hypothetical protein